MSSGLSDGEIVLLFDLDWARQETMATAGISFGATFAPLYHSDHLYILVVVYNVVHFSGVFMGLCFFMKNKFIVIRGLPAILATWGLYIVSRILLNHGLTGLNQQTHITA